MKSFWPSWLVVLAGAWCAASPWLLGYGLDSRAAANAAGVGTAVLFFNLMHVWRIAEDGAEIVNALCGFWLILSPFALDIGGDRAAEINAILVGIILVCLAVLQRFGTARRSSR